MDIIAGRQGTGKTHTVYERIAALGSEEKIFLIVPEQATFEAECALMEALGKKCVSNAAVMSMTRFAFSVIKSGGEAKLLTDDAKNMLVKCILDEKSAVLTSYAKCADKAGFADDTARLIAELKAAAVTPEELMQALCESEEPLKSKISDVYEIYSAYCSETSGSLRDTDDLMLIAAGCAADSRDVTDSYFFFDAFHTFDASAYPLLRELMRLSKGVTFTLTADSEEFFEITGDTRKKLISAAESAGDNVRTTVLSGKKSSLQEICFLESSFTKYANKKYSGENNAVKIREFDNIYDEVRAAAASICEYVREGARFDEIGLTASDLNAYAPVIENVFSHFGIPFYIDMRKNVAHYAPVRAFLCVLNMADGAYSVQDIIELVKTGCTPVSDEESEILDNYCLEYALKAHSFRSDFDYDPKGSYNLEILNFARRKITEFINDFTEKYKSASTEGERIVYAAEFVRDKLKSGIADNVACASAQGEYERANTLIQIYNKLLNVLESAYELFKDRPAKKGMLVSALTYCLSSANVGTIPATIDAVAVGDIVRSRAPKVKMMLALGVSDGAVPSVPSAGNLFSDSDKEALKKSGITLKNTTGYIIKKENFALYCLLAKPSERLLVSAVRSEDGARAFVLERLVSMFGASSAKDELSNYITNEQTAYDIIGEKTKSDENRAWAEAACEYFRREGKGGYAATLKNALSFDNRAQINEKEDYLSLLSASKKLSVTKLERYSHCPFSFFAQHILRPKERKTFGVSRPDIGSVIHAALDNFSNSLLNKKTDILTADDKTLNRLSSAATEKALEDYSDGIFARVLKSEYLKTKIRRAAVAAINETVSNLKASEFSLCAAEERFANIVVDTAENVRFVLEGRIDRVDTFENEHGRYVKVIDYKTSAHEIDVDAINAGISLQLPVYMNAAASEHGASGAGMFYFSIRPDPEKVTEEEMLEYISDIIKKRFKMSGIALRGLKRKAELEMDGGGDVTIKSLAERDKNTAYVDGEELRRLSEVTDENIKRLAEGIASANIDIHPYKYRERSACSFCKYSGICKFSLAFRRNAYRVVSRENRKEAMA